MASLWLLLTDNKAWISSTQLHLPAFLQVLSPGRLALAPRGRCLPSLGVVTGVESYQSAALDQGTISDHSKVAVGCKHVMCLAQSLAQGKRSTYKTVWIMGS